MKVVLGRVAWTVRQGTFFLRRPFRQRARLLRLCQDVRPVVAGVSRWRQCVNVARSLAGWRTHDTESVWAVTMVRNEADIVTYTVRHLLGEGVDRVVVANNLSTDSTPALLCDLAKDRRVIVVSDTLDAYYQGDKMSRLARAATRAGASWIVPFDADEAWYAGNDMSLSTMLRSSRDDVVKGYLENYVPIASNTDPNPYCRFQHRAPEVGPHKVAFRANFFSRIWTGNHDVSHPGAIGRGLRIAHVPYRSPEQMRLKVRVGSNALADATGLDPLFGAHWRDLADLDDLSLEEAFQARTEIAGLVHDPIPYAGGCL